MASVADLLLQGFTTHSGIHDYQHASRLYVGNNYEHSPKSAWLYHVSFSLDTHYGLAADDALVTGLMVKNIDLPKFTVEAKTMNSYNRPTVIQSKIKYDPVNITFHDDSAESVLNFWNLYYRYYYRDADIGQQNGSPNPTYYTSTKYGDRSGQLNQFGYQPSGPTDNPGGVNIIKAIKIYSLHQKSFTEYILVNPYITSFRHGTHNSSNGTGTLEHSMTIAYEGVLYGRGTVGPAVDGFATTYYDKTPSPLSPLGGGTASLFGPGGLVQSATEITNDLDNQNYLAAGLKAINAGTILKNTNLTTIAAGSLAALGRNIISGNNPLNTVFVPNSGNLAGTPAFGLPTVNSPIATGGITTNGSAVGGALAAAGLSIGALAAPTGAAGVAITAAITTGVLRKASSLGKLTTIDKSGAVTGTTNLPTQTDAEQALANAESNYPTAATAEENQQAVLDAYNQDQAAAAQSAADAAAAENTDTQSGQLNQDAGVSQDQNYA